MATYKYDPQVEQQQIALNKQGANLKVDGLLGPLTQAAIKKYSTSIPTSTPTSTSTYNAQIAKQQQELNAKGANLKVDGLLGPLTKAAITKYSSTPSTVSSSATTSYSPSTSSKYTYNPQVEQQQIALNKQGANLKVDGLLGPLTQAAIAKYSYPSSTTSTSNQAFTLTAGNLRQGSSGTNVQQLQTLLGGLNPDGKFGPLTKAAVIAFQKANGLVADGIVGPKTVAALNAKNVTPPPVTPISNEVPTINTSPPELPVPTTSVINESYYTGLNQQVVNISTQLENQRNIQLQKIQQDKQNIQEELNQIRSDQENAISQQGTLSIEEKNKKLEQLDIEQKRFDENYNKVQGLGNQLMDLMTQGNSLIASQKGVTGLGVIRNPRVAETINNITAQAGVIQAGISVFNGQMNQAQSQLQLATNTLTSAYSDQIDYYKTLSNFYESQANDTNAKLVTLTNDERTYLDSKINSLEADKKRIQDNAEMIQDAMVDPDTALAYASSGVTLNDTIPVINEKLAKYAYSKEISEQSNNMAEQGYTALISGNAPAGSQVVSVTDSKGKVKTYYKKATTTAINNVNRNYTATNIPDNIATELLDDLKNSSATLDDLYRLYPEVSSSYISSLYNTYHAITNPFQ